MQSRETTPIDCTMETILLLLQLPATCFVIACLPGNDLKLAVLLLLWNSTFKHLRFAEILWFLGISTVFTIMNALALNKGVFFFSCPDILRMPVYEIFMWGFYTLHSVRLLGGTAPPGNKLPATLFGIAFSLPFSLIRDSDTMTNATFCLLLVGVVLHHEPLDLLYMAYFVIIGAMIEYVGVHSGQWYYPETHFGGVPLWFVSMWGGIGLLVHRIGLPILEHLKKMEALSSVSK